MKKNLLLTLALTGLLMLAGCGGGGESPKDSSSPASTPSTSAPTSSDLEDESVSYVSADSDSGTGERTNPEPYDYESVKVNTPKNELSEGFAFGADLSAVAEVEANGGVYYNEDGVEQDVFKILAADGVNYCRLRVWNDPYHETLTDEEGNRLDYGGGVNDVATDIGLARRAKAAGMKVLLDFHYSDSWADPQKYFVPKAWADAFETEKPDLLYEFTRDALKEFKKAGIDVDAVQIGNEENYGIAGVKFIESPGRIVKMVERGVEAANEVFPKAKTLVHLTNIKSPKGVYNFLDAVKDVPYDIVGLSYYPFWHGTKANLLNVMNHIRGAYDRPVWIVETSYGFTDEQTEFAHNQYHSSTFETPGGYLTSYQGQMSEVADVVSTISEVKDGYGQGIFYWEPAWLPVEGTTWASKAGQFYNEHGKDGTAEQIADYKDESCLSSWANQGWFSYTGKALPSASTYRHIVDGDKTATEKVIGLRNGEVSVNVNLVKGEVELPSSALVVTDFDALREMPVAWNQTEVGEILAGGDGDYVVHGVVGGTYDIVANVTAETNYVLDYSFEEQPNGEQVALKEDPWFLSQNVAGSARIEAKSEGNIDGEKYFHWFNSGAFNFSLSQTIDVPFGGDYDLSAYIMAGDTASDYMSFKMWYVFGEVNPGDSIPLDATVADITEEAVKGWGAPLERYMRRVSLDHIEVPEGGSKITFGLFADCGPTAWGHCDLWSFSKHKEYVPPEEYVADGALEDGDFTAQTLWQMPGDPWAIEKATASKFQIANDEAMRKVSDRYLAWYDASAFSFAFHQKIKNLESGEYDFTFTILSATAGSYDYFKVVSYNGDESDVSVDVKDQFKAWATSAEDTTVDVTVKVNVKAGSVFRIGFDVSAKAGAWGRMTDLSLTKVSA